METVGIGEGILNRETHVGHSQLSLNRTVGKLHSTVDYRLRMNQHLDLVGIDTEKPFSLDDLESLVHHRRRVDGDLRSHVPCGMAQGIILSHLLQLLASEQAERASTCREQNLLYLIVALTHNALENGGMLTIHRQYRSMVFLCQLAYQCTSHNKRFLVGETDGLASLYGMYRRRETGKAHHSGENHID